jgi:tRNA(fMet)-specific endonuclease VapC
MNGKRILLDTNAIVALLRGSEIVSGHLVDAGWIGISIVSVLEYLSFSNLHESDRRVLASFLGMVEIIDLAKDDSRLIETIVSVRKVFRLKLPDAAIVASALVNDAILVTGDKVLFKITNLSVIQL